MRTTASGQKLICRRRVSDRPKTGSAFLERGSVFISPSSCNQPSWRAINARVRNRTPVFISSYKSLAPFWQPEIGSRGDGVDPIRMGFREESPDAGLEEEDANPAPKTARL